MARAVPLHLLLRRRVLAVAAALLLPGTGSAAQAAPRPAAGPPAPVLAEILADPRIQTAFPYEVAPAPGAQPAAVQLVPQQVLKKPRIERNLAGWGELLIILAWMAGFTAAVAAASWLCRYLPDWELSQDAPACSGEPVGAVGQAGLSPLEHADSVAAQGRFAEAMHVLLATTLQQFAQHTGKSLPAALTNREVLRRLALPRAQGLALQGLVSAVEGAWFGGYPVAREEYERCRAVVLELRAL